MARIGHWRDGEIGVFLSEEERMILGLQIGSSVQAGFDPVKMCITILRTKEHRTGFYPLYEGQDGQDAGWLRNKWPTIAMYPRWQKTEIAADHVTHEDGLVFYLPDWWDLPWPKYQQTDVRQATIDFLFKVQLTGRVHRPHHLVPPQAVNYARAGKARLYLNSINEFLPPANDQFALVGWGDLHCGPLAGAQ